MVQVFLGKEDELNDALLQKYGYDLGCVPALGAAASFLPTSTSQVIPAQMCDPCACAFVVALRGPRDQNAGSAWCRTVLANTEPTKCGGPAASCKPSGTLNYTNSWCQLMNHTTPQRANSGPFGKLFGALNRAQSDLGGGISFGSSLQPHTANSHAMEHDHRLPLGGRYAAQGFSSSESKIFHMQAPQEKVRGPFLRLAPHEPLPVPSGKLETCTPLPGSSFIQARGRANLSTLGSAVAGTHRSCSPASADNCFPSKCVTQSNAAGSAAVALAA